MLSKKIIALVAVAVPTAQSFTVLADGGEHEMAPDSTKWLEEVSVTSIKQSPDIRLQPTSSTVLGQSRIERLNIRTLKGVSEIAPNFYMPDYGSRMTSSIYVRGIGARMDQPAVGLSVDNVPFLNKDAYDFDLPDISRMEVIRGPQSTLYGRNTMAGQINIYTLSPLDYQGTRIMGEAGKGESIRLAASQYALLRENLGMGIAGYFNFRGGYYTNRYHGYKADKEKGGSLRWKTAWRPTERLSVDNTMSFTLDRNGGYPYEYLAGNEINYNDTCFYRRNILSDGFTLKWRGDSWTLTSITSVQYIDDNMTLDQDFLPLSYFTLTQRRHETNLTQDIVARGNAGDRYSWLGGLFAFYKHSSMHAPVTFKEHGIQRLIVDNVNRNPIFNVTWNDDQFVLGSDFRIPVYGLAAYHQSDLKLGRWTLSAGVRLDYEHVALRYHSHVSTSYTMTMKNGRPMGSKEINIDQSDRLKEHFLEFLPKVNVCYRLPIPGESDVYASVGKGYKTGGYNTQMFSDVLQQQLMSEMGRPVEYDINEILSYRPERSWNYEVGAHVSCADGRVHTDMSLFYIDCRDQQLTMFPDGSTTGRITTNAGKTRSFGAEVQVRYSPTSQWIFNTSYGYTNAKFVEFTDGLTDFQGNRVPYAPRNTFFASATYRLPVGRWIDAMSFNARVRGVGDFYWDEDNSIRQPFYATLGLSASATHKFLTVEVWGENLTDTRYTVFSFKSIGNTFVQRGKPLTWGVTARLSFDSNAAD